ncbi:hypothetical protein B296_00035951 [Ensete ventricosum]|uniref:Uncharacterized protein n=1 Tax=Ensete ventricosum TaxID=4639 RepID=A0A427A4B3_ENSVE|nr:hypothetical protein B296_00035951 [Ensete ventricosum]
MGSNYTITMTVNHNHCRRKRSDVNGIATVDYPLSLYFVSFSLPFIAFYRSVLNSISVAPELKKFPVFPFLSCVVSTALRFGFGFTVFDCDRIWLSVLLSTPFPVVLSVDL